MNRTLHSENSSLAVLAHELREPLTAIQFAAQFMSETPAGDAVSREMWAVVERQSQYLARIIDQVLEASRGFHGKILLRKDWFEINATITDAIETVKPLLHSRRHRLRTCIPPGQVYVNADALRVQQVVVNLLTNAAKYTEPGGCIELSLQVSDDLILIEVRDDGIGIPHDILPRIFDLYRQGKEAHHGGFAGLGIGLALVKSLVELHGGSVSAQSAGLGTGSTFVVRLPGANPRICVGHTDLDASAAAPVFISPWKSDAMIDA